MTDYSELVEALRLIGKEQDCNECEAGRWHHDMDCCLFEKAAAAIEALNRLLDQNTQRCEALRKQLREAHESYEKHLNELEAQMPKRGEWITIRLNNGGSYTGCSCCEAPIPTDTMLDYIPESESKYCYSCGAKMEVQDG